MSDRDRSNDFGDLALPYGLTVDGRMVSIADVPNGLACNCACPKCHRRLVAKKGAMVRHHFAHESDSVCAGAFETMAHLLAKQIIGEERRLFVPAVVGRYGEASKVVHSARWLRFDTVNLEVWQQGLKPDIVARLRGRELAVEIFVTHRCEPEKIALLRKRGTATIEISLGAMRHHFDAAEFRKAVLSEAPRLWVFNALAERATADLKAEILAARKKAEAERLEQEIAAAHVRMQREAEEAQARAVQAERDRLAHEEWLRKETERRERREKQEAERKTREAKEAEAAEIKDAAELADFKERITGAALSQLGLAEAERWLSRGVPMTGGPSVNQLTRMPNPDWYWDALARRVKLLSDAQAARDKLQQQLLTAAVIHFKDRSRADLWLHTTNPRLGRRRPIAVCKDKAGYDACLAALK